MRQREQRSSPSASRPTLAIRVLADDKHNWELSSAGRIKLALMIALLWDLAVPCNQVHVSKCLDKAKYTDILV